MSSKRMWNSISTYHYFNLTLEIEEHQNPEGTIALCHTYHDHADGKNGL